MKRLKVSDNRRFLVDEEGAPFFWLGDTAWGLFHRCTLEEAELYLEDRRRRGFNLVQAVALTEFDGLRVPNPNGDYALIDENPLTPNEAYFQHIDAIIQMAHDKGIYVGMLPTWGDKIMGIWGHGPVVFNTENAYLYGQWIARRYADRPNIVWIMGGDRPPQAENLDCRPIFRAMAEGVRSVIGDSALMTWHPAGQRSSSEAFHQDTWLDLNMWQSGHLRQDLPIWDWIVMDAARTPTKPVLDGEPNYEDHPIDPYTRQWQPEHGYFEALDVRKQAYRSVFAGACGHTYGHHSIWQFYEPPRHPMVFPRMTWREGLDAEGAAQLIHLKRLMLSRPYLTRIPDQTLIVSGEGEGMSHIRATRDTGGTFAMVYIPDGERTITLNLNPLSGETLQVWWYNPRDGANLDAGTLSHKGEHVFDVPAGDWVLVLDDASCQFSAPGADHRGE